jgi:hypothetical protein
LQREFLGRRNFTVRDRHNATRSSLAQADDPARTSAAIFHSVLFEEPDEGTKTATIEAPTFFGDLNLGQIIDASRPTGKIMTSRRFITPH